MDSGTDGKNTDSKTSGGNKTGAEGTGSARHRSSGQRKGPASAKDLDRVSGGYDPTISGSISF